MKVLVCVKQVPDMESKFRIGASGVWYDETDLAYRMNEYDEYAVEEAVRLKESAPEDIDVTALSIGPERVKEVIKKSLAMGCDRGVHIKDDEYYSKCPHSIASIIYEYAKDKNFDIIFAGLQSQDRGSAEVGVFLSELMDFACVTTVVGFKVEDGKVMIKRELEGGKKIIIETSIPLVATCQSGLNIPRYPTLPNIMKAKRKELKTFDVSEYYNVSEFVKTEKAYYPEKKGGALILEGDVSELVEKVVSLVKENTGLIK